MITGDILGERARLSPDTVALIHIPTRREFTYAELNRRALQCARVWTDLCALLPEDRVCILSENRVEYVDAFWAAGKSGIILVPLGTRSTARELHQILADCKPRCLMYSARYEKIAKELQQLVAFEHLISLDAEGSAPKTLSYAEAVDRVRPDPLATKVQPEDVFCLLYTSGTTGQPKGVMIPHRQIAWNAYNTAISWQLRQSDRVQVYTPMYHAGGLTVFLTPLFAIGGSIVLHDGFDAAEIMQALRDYQCTLFFGVPTIFKMLLESPDLAALDDSRLRWCASGGAPLPLQILRAYQERGLIFRQGYGLTEVGVNCFAMSNEDSLRKSGSVGKPMMFTEAKLLDPQGKQVAANQVGELCLRGPHVCRGYWNNPAATAQVLDAEGWFHTGDLARCDEDGFYYIAGRSKDMIISGGVNIYPAEIEKELLDHPAIAEVSVVGATDEKWGEVPVAFVALKSGARASADELIEFLRPRINKIKLPRRVIFTEALPRNAYGKVLKLELQDRLRNLKPAAAGSDTAKPKRKSAGKSSRKPS
ncbi:AMP-dependent synthetase and ligase [Candidatus Sulfotelmatobacter kueseliae]|uniref:AMP-dependent synthetase and ligase n=1 Tax=Candidatus Sulfotelmatobacter kueseliae TaxID=2042962 RepID=A0A2U3LAH7_9BACT|nr:AMP-dependent synthetase and ligase [Candidatus Sulfotelmatobacter kueseliae]